MKLFNQIKIIMAILSLVIISDSFAQRRPRKQKKELRDPFKRERYKRKSKVKRKFGQTRFGNLPSIEGVPLDKIRIVGVLLGKKRRAVAKIVSATGALSKDSYMLSEGMILGLNKAEIKGILPGGIVLVEKIRNVYDQDEYLETIIPVSY